MAPGYSPQPDRWAPFHWAPAQRERPLPLACGGTSVQGIPRRSFASALLMTPRQRLRICAALLALDEVPLDVVLSNEICNHIAEYLRHRHRLDKIGACHRKGLTF